MTGEFARVPLAEIRARLEAVSSPKERERLAAMLRCDPRSGARSLGAWVDRRERARRTERDRLVRFFSRRERLLQSGVEDVARRRARSDPWNRRWPAPLLPRNQ